jgi:hypothetical protein
MKKIILTLTICFIVLQTAAAQQTTKTPTTPIAAAPAATPTPSATPVSVPSANPADVSTLDGIMKAIYDVISGDAGTIRNWDRFRSLFHKDARLIPTGKNAKSGVVNASALTPEDYIKRVEPFFAKEGFFETEIARRSETYGHITHVFSTYASFHSKKTDEKPFARGINSFQLMFDGTRWWVVTIYWEGETTENPVPEKYLKNGN